MIIKKRIVKEILEHKMSVKFQSENLTRKLVFIQFECGTKLLCDNRTIEKYDIKIGDTVETENGLITNKVQAYEYPKTA